MLPPELFGIRFDNTVKEGTAELYNWHEMDADVKVLFFHSQNDYSRWRNGEPFKLINHWTKRAKPPNYRN